MRSEMLSRLKLSLAVAAIPACMALQAGEAKAVLVYELIPQGSDVQVKVSGSLTGLPAATVNSFGFTDFQPNIGLISFGSFGGSNSYGITGPANFGAGGAFTITGVTSGATQVGLAAFLKSSTSGLFLSSSYVQGDPITASGLITGQSLGTLGLSATSGLLATWTVGTDSIEVWAGAKPTAAPAAAAPGPLPLLGAGAAFGFSRRLRSRLRGASSASQV